MLAHRFRNLSHLANSLQQRVQGSYWSCMVNIQRLGTQSNVSSWRKFSTTADIVDRFSSGSSSIGFERQAPAPSIPLSASVEKGMLGVGNRGGKMLKSQSGVINIRNSWNNTMVAISDINYKMKGWVSAGTCGFKKGKRSSAFAQERVLEEAFKKARKVAPHLFT